MGAVNPILVHGSNSPEDSQRLEALRDEVPELGRLVNMHTDDPLDGLSRVAHLNANAFVATISVPEGVGGILVVTRAPLLSPGVPFVITHVDFRRAVGVVSFYHLPGEPGRTSAVVQALGALRGLPHCPNRICPMFLARTSDDIRARAPRPCAVCLRALRKVPA